MTAPVSPVEALLDVAAVDCSPSRARLSRVAALLREAQSAAPASRPRPRRQQPGGAVLALVPRHARPALPMPRGAADDPVQASQAD